MKKIYITPKERVITLNMDDMLMQTSGDPEDSINPLGTDEEALVKRQYKSLWDEEW